MRILVAHNFYQQAGGEDQVFADETALLEARGHAVERFIVRNDAVDQMTATATGKLRLAVKTVWNRDSAAALADRVRAFGADVVHLHNTFPLISPAAYYAARQSGAAVVQTIHNYRMLCPAATFYRDGAPCESCLGKLPIPAVVHACYRGSRATTAVAATTLAIHRLLGTYDRAIDAYIALSDFSRRKFIEAGFPADRLHLKSNFLAPDPLPGSGEGNFALFVGRLTAEKGVGSLCSAWRDLGSTIPLRICGDGPLAEEVRTAAAENPAITWLGRQPLEQVLRLMGEARFLVFSSTWYEGQPRTIIESFARGTPVLGSDLGSMTEMIDPGRTGDRFTAGDPASLAAAVRRLLADENLLSQMRVGARREFESRFTADANYSRLIEIYETALRRRHASQPTATNLEQFTAAPIR
jgi:glycosyltransferase involved in cell wall biosynthesis